MAKKDRLSRDQKRKAKLAKQARRAPPTSPLAYRGNKYKTDELVPVFFQVETGIHEADVMTGRRLTDRTVAAALERLIAQLRQGPLPPLADTATLQYVEGQEEDLLVHNLRRHLQGLVETGRHPGAEKLLGVLKTLLGSVEVWCTPSRHSRGYLSYVEGFLNKAGASVELYSAEGEPLPDAEEDELLEIGREWQSAADREAASEFTARAEELLRAGQAERVAEVCQRLIGETPEPGVIRELQLLAIRAHRALGG